MTSEFEAQLRAVPLRVTRPRVAVLAVLRDHPHVDTETVISLVRRIQPAGATARYETRVADNHHHLVCRVCGVVVDVDCAVGRAPCLTAADDHGFVIDEAEVVYWGVCPDCGTTSGTTDGTPLHQ